MFCLRPSTCFVYGRLHRGVRFAARTTPWAGPRGRSPARFCAHTRPHSRAPVLLRLPIDPPSSPRPSHLGTGASHEQSALHTSAISDPYRESIVCFSERALLSHHLEDVDREGSRTADLPRAGAELRVRSFVSSPLSLSFPRARALRAVVYLVPLNSRAPFVPTARIARSLARSLRPSFLRATSYSR